MTGKNKTIKFISTLLIISIILPSVLFSVPKKTNAILGVLDTNVADVATFEIALMATDIAANTTLIAGNTTTETLTTLKEWAVYIGKELLKAVAKRILAEMTQATVNWINSDFHGAPLFLENPQSFFTDIAKSELKTIVSLYGYDALRYPFGKDFALNAINSYKSQLADNAAYTLSNVMNSSEAARYRNDFNYGGWDGFLINTQYPQNNYIGFQMKATEDLAIRIQNTFNSSAEKVQKDLQQGMGFLSPQKCPSNPEYDKVMANAWQRPSFQYDVPPPDPDSAIGSDAQYAAYNAAMDKWDADKNKTKEKWAKTNTCPGGLVNTTPGSVAGNQVMKALGSSFDQTVMDGAMGNSLSAIFDALLGHFLDKGLNALSETINPAPPVDNWSYNGNTLSGGTNTTGNTNTGENALKIPQNVSITVGKTTSTVISGGSGYYSIQPQSNTSKAIAVAVVDMSSSSGPNLKITAGATPGTTSITVQDSSTPIQTVTVTITVNAIGALAVSPANISIMDNREPSIATISGGKEPYYIQTNSNESFAITVLSGSSLIVSGVTKGATYLIIKDSSTPVKTVRVPITINGPGDLVITPQNISVKIGEVSTIPISEGSTPYVVTSQQDTRVATGEILPTTPDMLIITGRSAGTTFILVRDSSNPFKTANVTVTVIAPQGICKMVINGSQTNTETDKTSCDTAGGTWTANQNP